MDREPREGEPTARRPFRLLYAKALVVLQPALRGPGRAAGLRVAMGMVMIAHIEGDRVIVIWDLS